MLAMVGYLGLLIVPDLSVVWALLTGVGAGTLFFLALAFFSLRAADPRSSASLSGMGQSIGYLFAALGPVAIGALHDATGGWTGAARGAGRPRGRAHCGRVARRPGRAGAGLR